MTKKEIIEQLESLKENQADFVAHDETGVFERDIEALTEAIKFLQYGNIETIAPEEVQSYYKDLFYRLFDIILSLDYEKNTKKQIKEVMYQLYDIYKKEI